MNIRMARVEDAPILQAIYAPIVKDTPISFELTEPTIEEMALRLTHTIKSYPWLVCTRQDEILGYAYASQHRSRMAYQWAVDVSVYISERWRGCGVGHALYTSLFALLKLQGFYNVYGGIALPNPGSVGLHESMGMIPVGIYQQVGYKDGAWHDVGWWQGILQERILEPAPPLTLVQARSLPAWDKALASGIDLLHIRNDS